MLNVALLKNCVLLRLKTSSFGNSRKFEITDEIAEKTLGPRPVDVTDDTWKEKIQDAKRRLKGSRKLILCKELDEIETYLALFRSSLLSRFANPSFIDDGLYAVRQAAVPAMVEEIKNARKYIDDALLPSLLGVYASKVDEARKLWNGSFKEKDYPSIDAMRGMFRITYRIVQLDVPEGLPPEIRAEEEAKLRAEFEKARTQIVEALWQEFKALVDHITDRLVPGSDGKLKTFQKGTVENIQAFIEAFANRNAFNDERLALAVRAAEEILASVGSKGSDSMSQRLRDFEDVRVKTGEAFAALKAVVDKGIEDLPGRSFSFDE